MKEFKGTKGEWTYEGGDNNSVDVILPNDTTISIDRVSRYTGSPVIGREQMEANAQLVAAAPEMLEALQEIIYGIETGLGNKHQLRVAKKALKKALGQ